MKDVSGMAFGSSRKVLYLMGRYPALLLANVACSVLTILIKVSSPLILHGIIEHSVNEGQGISMVLLLISCFLVLALCQSGRAFFGEKLGYNCLRDMRARLFQHCFRLTESERGEIGNGEWFSRLISDTESLYAFLSNDLVEFIIDCCVMIGLLMVLASLDIGSTLLILPGLVLTLLALGLVRNRVSRIFRNFLEKRAACSNLIEERLAARELVQAMSFDAASIEHYQTTTTLELHENLGAMWSSQGASVIVQAQLYSSIIMVSFLGSSWCSSAAMVVAFIEGLILFHRPLEGLAGRLASLSKSLTAWERVCEFLDRGVSETGTRLHVDLPALQSSLSMKNVSYSYDTDRPLLKDVSLDLHPGERVALIGPSGVGKSTILRLFSGALRAERGGLYWDKMDLSGVPIDRLRERIGLVPQRAFATIGHLEMVDSGVGARSCFDVILLDEPEYHEDCMTQLFDEGSAQLIVSHRVSTIKSCDRIVLLEAGRITMSGSHEDLLERSAFYRSLCLFQESPVILSEAL